MLIGLIKIYLPWFYAQHFDLFLFIDSWRTFAILETFLAVLNTVLKMCPPQIFWLLTVWSLSTEERV